MADPFSALAGVCAALQFLDFSAKFIEKTYKVYKDGDGAARNVVELEAAAGRLKAAAKANDAQQLRAIDATLAEKRMSTLCDECQVFADQLVTDLASLKTKGKPGLRHSAKMVLKADRRREGLRASEKRVEALKSEMSAQLLKILGDRQAAATGALNELLSRDAALQATISADMKQLRKDLAMKLDERKSQNLCLDDIQSLLEKLIRGARDTRIKQTMVAMLCYEGMDTRREIISETHADTYEWVFSPHEDRGRTAHLREWLQTGDGIFWVSGKPGSGKSTFMKFIHRHTKSNELLHNWAGKGSQLLTASHFFWVNGSSIQKSQMGLLREMCAAVARQCPEVFLDRWRQFLMMPGDVWSESLPRVDLSVSALRTMLDCVRNLGLEYEGRPIRFAFFIDGLDEYSGDHEELTEILKRLTSAGNVKICVASRPWNVFERAFGSDERRKLYMQRLTHEDISAFVQDKIGGDQHFQQLLLKDEAAKDIMDDIISRADGVFLWVYLVERQVHRSLVNRDGLEVLRRRVLQMPSDLNAYFKHMFDSLDDFYRKDTARIFRMCLTTKHRIPLLGFTVLDKENHLAIHIADNQSVERDDILDGESRLKSQICARCQDLIEIYSTGWSDYLSVTLMHRTVTDFLKLQETDRVLKKWSDDEFEPHRLLCEAYVVCFGLIPRITRELYRPLLITDFADRAMFHARQIERTQQRTPYRELDRLWCIAQALPDIETEDLCARWGSTKLEPLLPVTVAHGLAIYLKRRASLGYLGLSRPYLGRPLLFYAIVGTHSDARFRPCPEMIDTLLKAGNSPNSLCHVDGKGRPFPWLVLKQPVEATVWTFLLYYYYLSTRSLPWKDDNFKVCELLIGAGALDLHDPALNQSAALKVMFSNWNTERAVLERAFGEHQADQLLALRAPTMPKPPAMEHAVSTTSQSLFWRAMSPFSK